MPSLPRDVRVSVPATRLPPMIDLLEQSKLIKQGAEAKVYKTTLYPAPTVTSASVSDSAATAPATSSFEPVPALLKYRFSKQYRHPTLDALLTRQRLTSEARALVKCLRAGVTVPILRVVDLKQGVIGMEWIEGWSVREVLGGGREGDELAESDEDGEDEVVTAEQAAAESQELLQVLSEKGVDRDVMLETIGVAIAKMHLAEVIHGDLTTSNMMLRLVDPASPNHQPFEVVMIDFGLSSTSFTPEDRAVDLYVLERAFDSTHPVPKLPSGHDGTPLFVTVLDGYRKGMEAFGKKGEWSRIEKRLNEVRLRGRKRSMVG
ncbi:hypothetical protein ACM66B_001124 [Microbotryomycetes sp. NB124-2]